MRGWGIFLVLVSPWLVGCEPPRMVPVAPPGLEYSQVTPEKEEDAAEALGEQRARLELGSSAATPAVAVPLAPPTKIGEKAKTAGGVIYETLKEGSGAVAEGGKQISVHYVGTLESGREFESSRKRGAPHTFTLGAREVIPGWEQGIAGMKVGEIRRLTIPPELAYGDNPPPRSPIPKGATLVFEVEVTEIK